MQRSRRCLAAVGLGLAALFAGSAQAQVVISQVYGGSSASTPVRADFVELHNRGTTTADIGGWSVQYAAATGSNWQVTPIPAGATIPAGGYYLVREADNPSGTGAAVDGDVPGGINLSGSTGKVALSSSGATLAGTCPTGVVDFLGYGATANCFEGTGTASLPGATHASLRTNDCTDSNDNAADFSAISPPAWRNSASTPHTCGGAPGIPGLSISDASTAEGNAGTHLLTFTITLSSPAGAGGTTGYWSTGTTGTATAGTDFIATGGTVEIPAGADRMQVSVPIVGDTTVEPDETFVVTVENVSGATIVDGEGQGTILNDDFELTPISQVQGNGAMSPLANQVVAMRGIVTGRTTRGFYIQSRDVDADADPATSEGVYVFLNTTPPAVVQPGRWLIVRGTVQEYIPSADPGQAPLTEIGGSVAIFEQDAATYPLPDPVVLTADFPSPTGGLDQLERVESMRVRVPDFVATAPTDGTVSEASATSTSSGLFFGTVAGVARPFREPGIQAPDAPPSGSIPPIPRWDFNPEILSVDSDGLVGMPAIDLAAGAHIANLTGPLNFSFRRYQILPDSTTGAVTAGPAPRAAQAAPAGAFSIAGYNMERFFDDVDDAGISDVKLTSAALARRLSKASLGIRDMLHTPDILAVVEMENIGVLTSIANRVNGDALAATGIDPHYVPYLVEGNDVGGIDVGFLVKTAEVASGVARVEVKSVTQIGKTATYTAPDGGTSLLNDRPPLELDAVVHYADGRAFPVVVVAVHQRSLNGADTADAEGARIRGKRQKQAEFLAAYLDQRQHQAPDTRMVVLGDFNAFEFNDGLVDAMGTVTGRPSPDNETAVEGDGADLVTPDFVNLATLAPPAERYSFTFDGNAQSLDHVLVNEDMVVATRDIQVDHARINADFPEINRNDANSPSRLADHDPVVAYFVPRRVADLSVTAQAASLQAGQPIGFDVHLANAGPEQADFPEIGFELDAAAADLAIDAAAGWTCAPNVVDAGHTSIDCRADAMASGASADFHLHLQNTAAIAGRTLLLVASADAQSLDPATGNNVASAQVVLPAATNLSAAVYAPIVMKAGVKANYTLAVRNTGSVAAVSPALTVAIDHAPADVSIGLPADWTCAAATTGPSGFSQTCTAASLAPGARLVIPVGFRTPTNAPTITLRATVSAASADPQPADNSASETRRVPNAH